MRIISGKYKGKNLEGYLLEGTRPTMDRVKESIFAILQPYIKNSKCLDLFAGSGALGLEALSNGADMVTFVDCSKEAIATLKRNIASLQSDNCEILFMDYQKALKLFKENHQQFDLIFLDPPYHRHYIHKILDLLLMYDLVAENGQVICEFEDEKLETTAFELWKEKRYGSKQIYIYRRRK